MKNVILNLNNVWTPEQCYQWILKAAPNAKYFTTAGSDQPFGCAVCDPQYNVELGEGVVD